MSDICPICGKQFTGKFSERRYNSHVSREHDTEPDKDVDYVY